MRNFEQMQEQIKKQALELLEDKIEFDVVGVLQDKYGITSGDIAPWTAIELDQVTERMAELIAETIMFELDIKEEEE